MIYVTDLGAEAPAADRKPCQGYAWHRDGVGINSMVTDPEVASLLVHGADDGTGMRCR